MTTIADIYEGAERLINEFIRKEMVDQGHHLTGAMENSLESDSFKKKKAEVMEGFAIDYTLFVEHGFHKVPDWHPQTNKPHNYRVIRQQTGATRMDLINRPSVQAIFI